MKLKITDDTLIVFVYILSGVMLMGQFMSINIITSLAFAASFAVVFFLWILHIKKLNTIDILTIFIIGLSFASVIITGTSFSPSIFSNWIIFASVFLYFSVCLKVKLKPSTVKILFILNFMVGAFAFLAYFLRYDSAFYVTNLGIKYLTFGFDNPNALALFLTVIVFTFMQFFFLYKVRFGLLIEICCIGIFMFLIFKTLSRTSLLAVIFFIAISIIFVRKRHYYLPKSNLFKIVVVISPLLFAFLYMLVIDLVNQNGTLSFLVGEGKGLDSRQYVWNFAFELFKDSPIFGSYGYLISGAELTQMHNSHINVLVSYGIIVFALVCVFLYFVLNKAVKNARGTKRALSVWAFIVCLMLGSSEAILFSGGLSFYLLVGQFLLICNSNIENEGELRL